MNKSTVLNILKKIKPILIFPCIVLFLLLVATLLRISGTSVGIYSYLLDDNSQHSLLVGQPRTVRSDEWTVNTPFLVAQTKNNFQMINTNIGTGQDMAVVLDVPYLDWSILFRPQNIPFLIMPLEFAFAFKWWLLASLLLLSVYFFVLLIYPKKYLLASLLAIFFFLSPFIQWWYQSITLLPIAYSLIAVILAYNLCVSKSKKTFLISALGLSYTLTCFALIMYPAFQIGAILFVAS